MFNNKWQKTAMVKSVVWAKKTHFDWFLYTATWVTTMAGKSVEKVL